MTILKNISKCPLCFGGAAISGEGGGYGFGNIDENSAISLLLEARDLGIVIFDTAPIYGFGLSEKRMGIAFNKIRESVFIISKCGVSWHPNKRVNMTNDPATSIKMLEQSLRDLKSDYIDLYMVHWPDKNIDIRKTFEILSRPKESGKINHLGLCNTTLQDLHLAQQIDKVEVVQSEFNIFNRKASELFNYLLKEGISFMSWGTFDKGIITETVFEDKIYDKSDARSWAPWWDKKANRKKKASIQKIKPKITEAGFSKQEFAIGHNLGHKEISHVICGIKTSAQLKSAIKALDNLPSLEFINQIISTLD